VKEVEAEFDPAMVTGVAVLLVSVTLTAPPGALRVREEAEVLAMLMSEFVAFAINEAVSTSPTVCTNVFASSSTDVAAVMGLVRFTAPNTELSLRLLVVIEPGTAMSDMVAPEFMVTE
jgi:hypothetical protein